VSEARHAHNAPRLTGPCQQRRRQVRLPEASRAHCVSSPQQEAERTSPRRSSFLAQVGSFVPAASARIGLVDKSESSRGPMPASLMRRALVLTRVQAAESVGRLQSRWAAHSRPSIATTLTASQLHPRHGPSQPRAAQRHAALAHPAGRDGQRHSGLWCACRGKATATTD
jgi:hypothetical protein